MIEAIHKLPADALEKEITSSFSSLCTTVYHTWSAETIWLQRLELVEHPAWAEADFQGTFTEACAAWEKASRGLIRFATAQNNDAAFQHMCIYYDRQKISHKTAVWEILQHVFNHSTYHRGQLVTMLRQAGAATIPGTDFITYVRATRK